MRILYAVTGKEFGGAVRHVLQLIRHMAAKGHTVGLVAAPEIKEVLRTQGAEVQFYPNPHFVHPIRPDKDVQALMPVRRALREFSPDLVHAHSTKAGYAVRLWAAIYGIRPILFTAHGWAFAEGRELWLRRLLAGAERLCARVTQKIICVSWYDRDLALKWKVARPDQLAVVYNGIEPAPFLHADGRGVREQYGLDNEPVVTFVGRLAPQKNPLLLLEAFAKVPRGKLLIVGDGQLHSHVAKAIGKLGLGERVVLVGFQANVPDILAASDVVALSSRWEGLPYVVIEAMMAGLPVVSTAVGGVPELVEDGKTGFLVPSGDADKLASALTTLLEDERLRQRMGAAARERALREFTLDQMLSRTETIYSEVMAA